MKDYLTAIAEKALGAVQVVQPRLPSRFEPPAPHPPSPAVEAAVEPVGSHLTGENARSERPASPSRLTASPGRQWPSLSAFPTMATGRDATRTAVPALDREEPVTPPPGGRQGTSGPSSPAPVRRAESFRQEAEVDDREMSRLPAMFLPTLLANSEPRTASPNAAPPVADAPRRDADRPLHPAAGGPDKGSRGRAPVTGALAPIIRVTIGRIDVRAVHAPQPAPPAAAVSTPVMRLEDYLRRRDGKNGGGE
jgi:hypothetical protein